MSILCSFFYTLFLVFLPPVAIKRTKINRGQLLAAAVQASGLNKEQAAKKADYSRSAYYKHIENPNLGYHILVAYGKAIKYDFTEELPEMPKYGLEDPETAYGKPKTIEEAIRVADQWKNKYLELLEKCNRLIEERIGRK
jgi:hypothetical protein